MRKALVTGAAGFVGAWLADELRRARWRVTTLDRRKPADLAADLACDPLPRTRFDVVFHLAGLANPAASIGAAEDTYAANATAMIRVVHELRASRYVIASTGHVYGPAPRPIDETHRPAPRSPYAASKLCGEALALASGRDVVILRPFNHTGPGQSPDYVCPFIARQVARGRRAIRVADLAPKRDFFDVRDMARAYRLAAERGRPGTIYNVGTGKPVSIGRIAGILASLARPPLRVRGPRKSFDVLSADASRFRRHTGWRPRIPLQRTLRDLLEHEKRD